MRRQSLYLLLLAVLLLLLPIVNDEGVRFAIFDYSEDVSKFVTLLIDPRFLTEPLQFKALAAIYLMQSIGWIVFAVSLTPISLAGIIRNKSYLKYAVVLSILVLLHGVLEVVLSVSLGSVPVVSAIFTRFGVDITDFIDDYDALINSTLVPIGLIAWYYMSKRARRSHQATVEDSTDQISTEIA